MNSSCNKNVRENYGDNELGLKAKPQFDTLQQTGDLYSPCASCPLIKAVQADRTDYDKFWLRFYNQKASATNYDLLSLQFAP